MTRRPTLQALACAAALALALGVSACGGSSTVTTSTSTPAQSTPGGFPTQATVARIERCMAQHGVKFAPGQPPVGVSHAKALQAAHACRRYFPPGFSPGGG